ncbi:MAG: carboxyl transferase domain-containing protein, partial [Alphaproteobacteria bacterium]
YGFLSESAELAAACAARGITFIGPSPETLTLLGDKGAARALAEQSGVPVLAGTKAPSSLADIEAFFDGAPIILKAAHGGGGRGMRVVRDAGEIADAFDAAAREAESAFGNGALFAERLVENACHIEVQVIADSQGHVSHLWERDCTLQRRHQKLIEMAPAPFLDEETRSAICAAAVKLAQAANYQALGTFEFLLGADGAFHFMEANPRLQVEHPVTEVVTGIDLVAAQIRVMEGATLAALGLDVPPPVTGFAIEVRVNAEQMKADGTILPSAGTVSALSLPTGPAVRVDTAIRAGDQISPLYDSLVAKVIVAGADYAQAMARTRRALAEVSVQGPQVNAAALAALMARDEMVAYQVHTRIVDSWLPDLAAAAEQAAGASAVTHQKEAPQLAEGQVAAAMPLTGSIVELRATIGDTVKAGDVLAVVEAMKMEHLITAPTSGTIAALHGHVGDVLDENWPLFVLLPSGEADAAGAEAAAHDLDYIRPDLQAVIDRHDRIMDDARGPYVEKRHAKGLRTARENIADLTDEGSFVEYGALALAAQRSRMSVDELIEKSPADAIITGLATVNGETFGQDGGRCAVVAVDYMAMAGTQGYFHHKKMDRIFGVAEDQNLPVILYAEGGGGRPNDYDNSNIGAAGLDVPSFGLWARLSGKVPRVGIVAGYCFAGNAALAGCSDIIIATEDSNLGMGGPAMIEGGGLGEFHPKEVGPMSDLVPNGTVDILVKDEAEATAIAKQYLSYFQGDLPEWEVGDQRVLRHVIPENRRRAYEVRDVIHALADAGSVLEMRPSYGIGMITAFARIEGKPFGVIANNPHHLGGAIDADASDKGARFLQLCDTFGLPILSLCDTPGFMVGPDVERDAQVRHTSRLFVTGASLTVPVYCIVLRKSYGLGAMAMMAGGTHYPVATASWPTGEFGGMGLEGAVRLGARRKLEAIEDLEERERVFQEMVDASYERGKALNIGSMLEFDAVIDPAETRRFVMGAFRATDPARLTGGGRSFVDTW